MTSPLDAVIPLLLLALPVGIAIGLFFDSSHRDFRRAQAADYMASIGILTSQYPTDNHSRLEAYTAKRAGLRSYRLPWGRVGK